MASRSTSTSQSGNTLPELRVKLRPCEDCFSACNLDTEYNNCVSTDLKSLAVKDKKLLERVKIFEAENNMKTEMRKLLTGEAEKIKKEAEDEDEDEDEETDEDSDNSDSVDKQHEVKVMIPLAAMLKHSELLEDKAALTKLEVRSFIFKIWLRRIQLTRETNQDIYNGLLDFEHAIHNAQEAIKQFKEFYLQPALQQRKTASHAS